MKTSFFYRRLYHIIIFVSIAILVALLYPLTISNKPYTTIKINGANEILLKLEVADDPQEQEQGLSGKLSMPENEGMLFIFPKPIIAGFWMKDMHFPIDIIWLNDDKKIIQIDKNVAPETYPNIFTPKNGLIRYVLEVNAGYSAKNDLSVSDTLEFSLPSTTQ